MAKRIEILPKKKASEMTSDIANEVIQTLRGEEQKGKTHRITFDMPMYLHEMMKEKMAQKGDTMRNYMVALVRKDVNDVS